MFILLYHLKIKIMALWKISAKNKWNWGKGQMLEKGMFIEMSTGTTAPPLGVVANRESIAAAFNSKYSMNLDKSKISNSYFICERID
jgi:hypothetical protein